VRGGSSHPVLEFGESGGVSLAGGKVIGKSCISRSRVAGLSGSTINRGGGVVRGTGQGTGLCAQPPSQISAAASSGVKFRVKFTFHLVAPRNVGHVRSIGRTQGFTGDIRSPSPIRAPFRPDRR
jgi:hypothetical protein